MAEMPTTLVLTESSPIAMVEMLGWGVPHRPLVDVAYVRRRIYLLMVLITTLVASAMSVLSATAFLVGRLDMMARTMGLAPGDQITAMSLVDP